MKSQTLAVFAILMSFPAHSSYTPDNNARAYFRISRGNVMRFTPELIRRKAPDFYRSEWYKERPISRRAGEYLRSTTCTAKSINPAHRDDTRYDALYDFNPGATYVINDVYVGDNENNENEGHKLFLLLSAKGTKGNREIRIACEKPTYYIGKYDAEADTLVDIKPDHYEDPNQISVGDIRDAFNWRIYFESQK